MFSFFENLCFLAPSGILLTVPPSLQPSFSTKSTSTTSQQLISVDQSKKLLTVIAGHTVVIECLVDQSRPPTNVTASSENNNLDIFSISQEKLKQEYLSINSNKKNWASRLIQPSENLPQLVISEPETNTFKTTARYTFVPDTRNQDDIISCNGKFWEVFSKTKNIKNDYKLNVLSKPVVKTIIEKTSIIENLSLNIDCEIKSANPEIKSLSIVANDKQNGNKIILAEKKGSFDESPSFNVKILRNFNSLSCQAENEVGLSENSQEHKINVFFGPEPREALQHHNNNKTEFTRTIEIKSGQALSLSCEELFESSPPPQLKIEQYLLSSAEVDDSGVYECTAFNTETKKRATIFNNLQVHGVPKVKSLTLQKLSDSKDDSDNNLFCDYVAFPAPTEVLMKMVNVATGQQHILNKNEDEDSTSSRYSLAEVKQIIAAHEEKNKNNNENGSGVGENQRIYSVECRVRNVHGEHYITQEFDFSEENSSFILHVAIGTLITIGFVIFLTLLLIYFKNKIISKDQGSFNCGDSGKNSDKSLISGGNSNFYKPNSKKSSTTGKTSQNSSLYESDGQITGNSGFGSSSKNAYQYDDHSCSITDDCDILNKEISSECSHQLLGTRSSSSNEGSGTQATGSNGSSSNRDDGYYTDGHHAKG